VPAEALLRLAVIGLLISTSQDCYYSEVHGMVSGTDAVDDFECFEGGERELKACFFL
jgi:hypothetical protein